MKAMIQTITNAVDWLSVKITVALSIPAFIIGNGVMIALGALSLLTNIIYNTIRIRKELKNK